MPIYFKSAGPWAKTPAIHPLKSVFVSMLCWISLQQLRFVCKRNCYSNRTALCSCLEVFLPEATRIIWWRCGYLHLFENHPESFLNISNNYAWYKIWERFLNFPLTIMNLNYNNWYSSRNKRNYFSFEKAIRNVHI